MDDFIEQKFLKYRSCFKYFFLVVYIGLGAKVYQAKKKSKYFEGTKNIVFKLLHRYVYKTNWPIVEHYIISFFSKK